jgi:hypothetical protein
MSHHFLLGFFLVMAKKYDEHPQRTRSVTKGWNLASDVGGEAEFQLGAKSVKGIRRGNALLKEAVIGFRKFCTN